MESNKLKIKAIQNPFTPNPDTKESARRIIIALITSRNNPRVKIVTGRVNIRRIGLTIRFSMASTTATIIAVPNPATETPGRNVAIKITAKAVNKMRMINFIINLFRWLVSLQKCKKNAGIIPAFYIL
jgi:hypothetical protein